MGDVADLNKLAHRIVKQTTDEVSGETPAQTNNFARPHKTLSQNGNGPTTPAMAAGGADHVWSLREIAGLLDSLPGSRAAVLVIT